MHELTIEIVSGATLSGGSLQRIDDIVVEVMRVAQPGNHQLLAVVHAVNRLSLLFGLCQGGKQRRGENGDDGNYNQQFNQRKTVFAVSA